MNSTFAPFAFILILELNESYFYDIGQSGYSCGNFLKWHLVTPFFELILIKVLLRNNTLGFIIIDVPII